MRKGVGAREGREEEGPHKHMSSTATEMIFCTIVTVNDWRAKTQPSLLHHGATMSAISIHQLGLPPAAANDSEHTPHRRGDHSRCSPLSSHRNSLHNPRIIGTHQTKFKPQTLSSTTTYVP